ncbi:MAG: thiamine diphosphokinase [Clostridia bacterium]|nr:thiamine diphosphokinase [Clostridia bacterium]
MKRVILLLNGEPYSGEIDAENAIVLCADGAYDWAHKKIRIDENIGDFDSVKGTPFPPPKTVYPSQKNQTDGEIALERAMGIVRRGEADSIEIYGGGGGREDHFLGNLNLLHAALHENVPCVMITDRAEIFAAQGNFSIENIQGKTVSLFPFGGNAHIMSSKGLFYPTDDLTLTYGSCRGVSNVGVAPRAEIQSDAGVLLVFVNKECHENHLCETAEAH